MRMERLLPPHGNYRALKSCQKADVVYDITYRFWARFLTRGDRTIDQMVQAARSGKQNIVEGSKAAITSKEMELKLTHGVALEDLEVRTDLGSEFDGDMRPLVATRRRGGRLSSRPGFAFERPDFGDRNVAVPTAAIQTHQSARTERLRHGRRSYTRP